MGKRRQLWHPDSVREKIKVTQLVNRLQRFIEGEIELTPARVRAIEILLKKCVPDLSSTEVKSDVTVHNIMEVPPVLATSEEWEKKYGKETLQ